MSIFFKKINITDELYDDYTMIVPEKNMFEDENNIDILLKSFSEIQGPINEAVFKIVAVKSSKKTIIFYEEENKIIDNFMIKNQIEENEYYIIKGPIMSVAFIGFILGVQIFRNYNFFIGSFKKILRYKSSEISMTIIY